MFVALSLLLGTAWAGNVNYVASGSWADAPVVNGGSVATAYNIWVDMSVYNLAYEKIVGIRWTDDNWTSWHEAAAWYEGDLGGGYEQWGVDIEPLGIVVSRAGQTTWPNLFGTSWRITAPVTVQYAIFYRESGSEWWDNNGGANYRMTLW